MPKINVYLPDELADAVRATGVPISTVCQRALEAAVREVRDAKLDSTVTPTLERFTDRARHVVALASAAALAENIDLGSEHVLLGLLNEAEGAAAVALGSLGITADAVTRENATRSSMGDGREVYRTALKEALKLGHNYIGTEHLLLAIAETPCTGREILAALGANRSAVKHQVLSTLTNATAPPKRSDVASKLDEVIRRLEALEQRLAG